MRKIKNRATIFFLCVIIISNFLTLYAGYGLTNDEGSNFYQDGSLNFNSWMKLPNEQDILALIKSQSLTNEDSPKIASLNEIDYSNWWIEAIGADNLGYNGSGVKVAILDTGIYDSLDYNVESSWDFIDDVSTTFDGYGHGTHVAGIIGGNGDGSSGNTVVWPLGHCLSMPRLLIQLVVLRFKTLLMLLIGLQPREVLT